MFANPCKLCPLALTQLIFVVKSNQMDKGLGDYGVVDAMKGLGEIETILDISEYVVYEKRSNMHRIPFRKMC
ncbi:hypothetical protein HanIR_Chr05g0224511 [Helianthus annuus]|nr:hypothetical protein HanIR_Chr05g0224511 [Helianthus annuus]